MAYVRRRGNQLALVHGERDPETGKVQQRILFTLYSRPEALEAIGQGTESGRYRFRSLVGNAYPAHNFDWKAIDRAIARDLDALPEEYEYEATRLVSSFRRDLAAFAKQLILADPQWLFPAARVVEQHRPELTWLVKLIGNRLRLTDQKPREFNQDNRFFWRFALRSGDVPGDVEEEAADLYGKGDFARAEPLFRLLIDCFDDYAEGYNYLGLIALQRRDLPAAIGHFRRTIDLGRRLFPRRIAKPSWWTDHSTRPYMRGLANLALALNETGQFKEAEAVCDRIESETGDRITANAHRASIALNTGRWMAAAKAAVHGSGLDPTSSLVAALARYEAGQRAEALSSFLHGAINVPRAARILLGERTTKPKSSDEARDHNSGVHLWHALHAYRARRPVGMRLFGRILKDARVRGLLDESEAVVRRWHEQHRTGNRDAFERMNEMRTPKFAEAQAARLADLLPNAGA